MGHPAHPVLVKPIEIESWATLPLYNVHMPISARNKLQGKIEEIQLGDIMAHVVVRVGDNLIESAITRRSADELKLKKGDVVTAVVKATEVMIQKD
jgi:molybdopterin-binding protein